MDEGVIMDWVIFDMSNQNTLVALAYIKSEDNPLTVFATTSFTCC